MIMSVLASPRETFDVRRQKAFLLVYEVLLGFPDVDLAAGLHPDGLGAVLVHHVHAFFLRHGLAGGALHERDPGDRHGNVHGFVGAGGEGFSWRIGGAAPGLDGVEGNLLFHELAVLPSHLLAIFLSGPNLLSTDDLPSSLAVEAGHGFALGDLLDVAHHHIHGRALEQIHDLVHNDSFSALISVATIATSTVSITSIISVAVAVSSVVAATVAVITVAITVAAGSDVPIGAIVAVVAVTVPGPVSRAATAGILKNVHATGSVGERLANGVGDIHADFLYFLLAVGYVHGGAALLGSLLVVLVRVLRHVCAELFIAQIHGPVLAVENASAKRLLEQHERQNCLETLHV